mgnify:FL=1
MMIAVYLNYPRSRVCVHHNPGCSKIQQAKKPGQRRFRIDDQSRDHHIEGCQKWSFLATSETNDMWLQIDLRDYNQEVITLEEIIAALGSRYRRFARPNISRHC